MSEYAAICIGSENIKLLYADIAKNKQITVKKTVHAGQTGDFVFDGKLCQINSLVDYICDILKSNDIMCKKILLCSDFLGGETALHTEENHDIGIKDIFCHSKEKTNDNYAEDSKKYGNINRNGENKKVSIVTTVDSYLLKSLCLAFSERGYSIASIQKNLTADIALAQLCPHSYDNQYKIIIDVSDSVTAIFTYLDIPFEIRDWNIDFTRLGEQINDCLFRDTQSLHIKNPQIFLGGAKLVQSQISVLKKHIQNEGFSVFDYQSAAIPDDFAICLGTILDFCKYGTSSLCRYRHNIDSSIQAWAEKYKKHIRRVFVISAFLSAAFIVCSAFLLMLSQKSKAKIEEYEYSAALQKKMLEDLNNNQIQLTSAVYDNEDLILLFDILCDVNENLTISSVDTHSMLPHIEVSGTAAAEQPAEQGTTPAGIVIRGYALNGTAVIDLQSKLNESGIYSEINGIDTVRLPQGEQIQFFEIEVLN